MKRERNPFVFAERLRAGPLESLSRSIAEEIPAVNVVNVAVPVIITAVAGLFAGIGPDEIRKSRMRNIQTAVSRRRYFRLFSGGGIFYPLPHRPLSNGLRKASPKTTRTKENFLAQTALLPKTDMRQKWKIRS